MPFHSSIPARLAVHLWLLAALACSGDPKPAVPNDPVPGDSADLNDDSGGSGGDSGGSGGDSGGSGGDSGGDDTGTVDVPVWGGHPRNPFDAALLPIGSQADGTTTATTDDGIVFRFTFEGDETLRYVIDTADASVAGGVLKIVEETTGAQPLAGAAPRYREADGTVRPGAWFRGHAEVSLLSADLDGGALTLQYQESMPSGVVHTRSIEIEMVGKALRVRVLDNDADLGAVDNYAGFDLGPVDGLSDPHDLKLPYMISTPLVMFSSTIDGSKAFVTTQIDWSKSNATTYNQPWSYSSVDVDETSVKNSYSLRYNQGFDSDITLIDSLLAPLDETFWVLVTRTLSDTFPETEAQPSPYRDTLAARPVVLMSGNGTDWEDYQEQVDLFHTWGMDHLAIYYFYWWSAAQPPSGSTPPQVPSHIWAPARDESAFIELANRTSALGFLHGYYTLYSMNSDQPHHDPVDQAVGDDGRGVGMAPARSLSHSMREDTEMRTRYGTSLSFHDVLGYRHPQKRTDHVTTDTTRSKTIAGVLGDKRALFQQMADLHEGPAMSEGSIATIGSNYELLFAGFVDSTEACINGAAGGKASELDPDDPYAPENWWLAPDYALRVLNRTQAPHSNGFYNRFFASPSGGPYPLVEEKMDRYRIYTITYGKTGYFHSNGPINGTGNLMVYADMIKEYYLLAGLQEDYLSSTIDAVGYWDGTDYQTLEGVLTSSASDDPLDDLRDARIRQTWASGLVIHLNHSETTWTDIEVAGTTFTLPEDGWIAHNPTTGLLAFSAIPADLETTRQRIDYAHIPDRYTLLDGRGDVVSYGGLSNPEGWLVVSNAVHDLVVTELDGGEITTVVGTAPALERLAVQGPNRMSTDTAALFKARATMDNGAMQEFPYTLGSWSSSSPTVASVNRAGVVNALLAGETEITFTADGISSSPRTIRVEAP